MNGRPYVRKKLPAFNVNVRAVGTPDERVYIDCDPNFAAAIADRLLGRDKSSNPAVHSMACILADQFGDGHELRGRDGGRDSGYDDDDDFDDGEATPDDRDRY